MSQGTLSFLERIECREQAQVYRSEAIRDQVAWARAYQTLEKPGSKTPYDYKLIECWVPMLQAQALRKLCFKSRKVSMMR